MLKVPKALITARLGCYVLTISTSEIGAWNMYCFHHKYYLIKNWTQDMHRRKPFFFLASTSLTSSFLKQTNKQIKYTTHWPEMSFSLVFLPQVNRPTKRYIPARLSPWKHILCVLLNAFVQGRLMTMVLVDKKRALIVFINKHKTCNFKL